ncbi:DJA6, partial [Symbiodinium natans]
MAAEILQVAVSVDDNIPKLLVKISPSTCTGFAAKNLGEVTLRKPGAQRGHVAVLHLSSAVPVGSVFISLKLSELLEVASGDQVQIVHSDRIRRTVRRETGQDTSSTRRSSWGDLLGSGQHVQAARAPTSVPRNEPECFGRPLQESSQSLHARPGRPQDLTAQAADELGTEFSPLPKAMPRTRIQSPNQMWSQKASNLGFANPPLPVEPALGSPVQSARCAPQRSLTQAFAQAAQSRGEAANKTGYSQTPQPQPVQSPPQVAQPQPFTPASRTVFKPTPGFAQPGSPGIANRTLNANPAFGASRPVATAAPATGRQAEVADWLPAAMGSPVWQAAQQPPPASPPALIPKTPPMYRTEHSPSPSPPKMRPEGVQPKVLSPTFRPQHPQVPQPTPQGALPHRVRQSVPHLPSRRAQSHSDLPPAGRRTSEMQPRGSQWSSPLTSPLTSPIAAQPQSLSPPPLRMPQPAQNGPNGSSARAARSPEHERIQSPKDCEADRGSSPPAAQRPSFESFGLFFGPFHAPPGHPLKHGPRQDEASQQRATMAPAECLNGSAGQEREHTTEDAGDAEDVEDAVQTKETSADRSLSPAQHRTQPAEEHTEEAEVTEVDHSLREPPPLVQRRSDKVRPTALVHLPGGARSVSAKPGRLGTLRRPTSQGLGHLQCEPCSECNPPKVPAAVSCDWRRPQSTGGGLERSELGPEITSEVRRWLLGLTEGLQCSHVVMDKALTVLSNFKLSSGCELEVLGGPLGAIVGGYNEADWLHQEIFSKTPADAVKESFEILGFSEAKAKEGDWSGVMVEEVSLAYRRQCLRGHPSRGGPARGYLKLQVAMEVIRAFCGEAGPLTPEPAEEISSTCFVLDDLALARELELTPSEAALEADSLPTQRLEELNRALDEYILRQMCFKSEIVAEIARLHENSAYSILGVSPDASDAEIKKAYRVVAMQCHPDKGGDKAEFQELHEAYEKIMEQRRSSANLDGKSRKKSETDSDDDAQARQEEKEEKEAEESHQSHQDQQAEEKDSEAGAEPEESEDGSDAQLLAKAAKAADEASHYAKTAAEFAHQAAEAAETARQGRDSGGAITLTKSIAHSAIVLTLTVVKAVRVVGYATMDVAAQCRLASRKFTEASCAESSTEAMGLGLEALNAALACAEVTETTAAELQTPEGLEAAEAAERFVNAAVRASLAAASASNAAMSAAIAAVEGHRQCMQAVEAKTENKESAEEVPEPPDADKDDASEVREDQSQKSDDSDDESTSPPEPRRHSKEDSAQAAVR